MLVLTGTLGTRIPGALGAPEPAEVKHSHCFFYIRSMMCQDCSDGVVMCFQWGNVARVEITDCEDTDCFLVSWTVTHLRVVEDCMGKGVDSGESPQDILCQTLDMVIGTGAQRSWCSISP